MSMSRMLTRVSAAGPVLRLACAAKDTLSLRETWDIGLSEPRKLMLDLMGLGRRKGSLCFRRASFSRQSDVLVIADSFLAEALKY
jgi:hypothetical protein